MKTRLIGYLRNLYKDKMINKQQFRTFKGQVISGDSEGAVKGLDRLGISRKK